MWDFTLVDPDNRRPVDFEHRRNRLETLIHDRNLEGFTGRMLRELYSGDIKLWFTHTLLSLRKSDPDLFLRGKYIPVEVHGTYKEYFLSYARKQGSRWLIVVIPLHLAALQKDWHEIMNQKMDWAGTDLLIPKRFTGPCLEILSGRKLSPGSPISLNDMFVEFPMAVLGSI
jgi:maltooligosyltrehalose synthase